jgi:hypothetical protein
VLFEDKINILEQKVVLKDSIIFNLNSKLFNFNNISLLQSQQLEISQQLSKRLEQDLKKQKLQTKVFKYSQIKRSADTNRARKVSPRLLQ